MTAPVCFCRKTCRPAARTVAGREIFSSPHVAPEKRMGFSFAAPLAGRDDQPAYPVRDIPNFNPRAPCGARHGYLRLVLAGCHFNPRTPCGVRLDIAEDGRIDQDISIHAPLAGCDAGRCTPKSQKTHFNPRTPCGVRLRQRLPGRSAARFQSTHPLRGATPDARAQLLRLQHFNPRTPCGVRPKATCVCGSTA